MRSLTRGVMLSAMVFLAGTAAAATFDVNLTADDRDSDPGDGVCRAELSVGCTLRAAIQEANALAGNDVINLPAGTFTLTITGAGEDNAAAGDLDVRETLWIYGQGMDATRINAAGIDRVFDLRLGVLQLVDLTVTGGRATSLDGALGGGIRASGERLVIGSCRLTGNVANQGGAIFASASTAVQIADSVLDGNATENTGITNPWGAAIRAEGGLELSGSTVTGNTGASAGNFAVDAQCFNGTVLILNSTVAANSCSGIGTYNCDAVLSHVTVAENSSYGVNMGSYLNDADITVVNSIVAGNNFDCYFQPSQTVTIDHCLDGDDTCGLIGANGDLPMTDPQLLPLRNWGGMTQTMYPRPVVSPVIDAGDGAACYITDQRGEVRGGDGNGDGSSGCDMGAVEAGDLVFYDDLESASTDFWSAAAGLVP